MARRGKSAPRRRRQRRTKKDRDLGEVIESARSTADDAVKASEKLEAEGKALKSRKVASQARALKRKASKISNELSGLPEAANELSERASKNAAELDKIKKEKSELMESLIYLKADFENFKKRTEKESGEAGERARVYMVTCLLDVLDNFERALATSGSCNDKNFARGVQMIYSQFLQTLEAEGLKIIPAVGESFDPFRHDAVEKVEVEGKENNEIVAEVQRGYMLKSKVIRPSKVKVNIIPERGEEEPKEVKSEEE